MRIGLDGDKHYILMLFTHLSSCLNRTFRRLIPIYVFISVFICLFGYMELGIVIYLFCFRMVLIWIYFGQTFEKQDMLQQEQVAAELVDGRKKEKSSTSWVWK